MLMAPQLMAVPARKVQPPSNITFFRPNADESLLATSDEARPAMYKEDVNNVRT